MRFPVSLLLASLLLSACSQQPQHTAPVPDTPPVVSSDVLTPIAPSEIAARKTISKPAAPDPATQNLWQLLINDFALSDHAHARIDAQLRWLQRHPRYLLSASQNAAPYLYHIRQQLLQHDMPSELALLPIVESAYVIKARSPDSAAGLWQFMPATGRSMGLRQDWWYDGRLDPIASTSAAIKYLKQKHNTFDDWLLALAAYNTGEGNVRKAIRRNKRLGKPTDYWSLDLARETDIYVPRLLAIAKLLQQQQQGKNTLDNTLQAIPNTPYFRVVDIEQQLDLQRAAQLAGVSNKELRRLNAAFKRWATAPAGPHRLLIPSAQAETFSTALAALPADQRTGQVRYKVQRGDTLSHIAQRFGTSVSALKKLNKLQSTRIRARQQLLVPAGGTAYVEAPMVHKVRAGDSLWTIARRYDTSVRQLARLNNISTRSVLRVGQRLRVRG